MALECYYVEIPGNYLKHWLNEFEAAVADESTSYTKIKYPIWRELERLSNLDKIKFYCQYDSHFIITFTFNSLIIDNRNSFGAYLRDCKIGLKKDKIFPQLNWSKIIDAPPFSENIINNNKTINNEIINNKINFNIEEDLPNALTTTATAQASPITYTTYTGYDSYTNEIKELTKSLAKLNTAVFNSDGTIKTNNKKDNNTMNTNDMFNFDFGPVNDSKIRMSMYGYAIPNENGKYVSYDVKSERMMDVQILNFDCAGMFYKIPKAIKDIDRGDVVFHNGVPMFVIDIYEDRTRFIVIDPTDGTEKTILPAHSPFGFDYLTTLVSLMDNFNTPASDDNPFGNMLPFILMGNSKNNNSVLPLLFMMNDKMDMSNPFMLMALSGNNGFDINNPLMLMSMMKSFNSK